MDEEIDKFKDIFKFLKNILNSADITDNLDQILKSEVFNPANGVDKTILSILDKIMKNSPKKQTVKKNKQYSSYAPQNKQYLHHFPNYSLSEKQNFYIIKMALGPHNYLIGATCQNSTIQINGICHQSKTYIYNKINVDKACYSKPYKEKIQYLHEADMYHLSLIFEKRTE